MSEMSYLVLMFLFAIAPSLVILCIVRKDIKGRSLLVSLLFLFVLGVIWDQVSVRMGIWSFSEEKTVGNLGGIPIEEYVFIVFVPLLSITVYTLFARILKR